MFDTIGQAVVQHDGIRILHVNEALRELFRYPSCEAVQRLSVFDLVAPEAADLAIKRSDKLRHNPDLTLGDAQYIFLRADRTRFVGRAHTRDYRWALDPPPDARLIFWTQIVLVRDLDEAARDEMTAAPG